MRRLLTASVRERNDAIAALSRQMLSSRERPGPNGRSGGTREAENEGGAASGAVKPVAVKPGAVKPPASKPEPRRPRRWI